MLLYAKAITAINICHCETFVITVVTVASSLLLLPFLWSVVRALDTIFYFLGRTDLENVLHTAPL